MLRQMRRKRQQLSDKEVYCILENGTSGVLALQGDEDYPYAVPLNYVYVDGKIYFHSAKSGHKLDAIKKQPKASFCVIGQDIIKLEEYTSYFKSVIAFGKIKILEKEEDIHEAINKLAIKYVPNDSIEKRQKAIMKDYLNMCMFVLEIEYLTGKEAMGIIRERENNK